MAKLNILVTGGCGFIGAHFVQYCLREVGELGKLINLDNLTYAAGRSHLKEAESDPRYTFVKGDIADPKLVAHLLEKHRIRYVVHLAAESHVDRSIENPRVFLETNVLGSFDLLECCRRYFEKQLTPAEQKQFRFLHVSTDEVYGALTSEASPFTESTPYAPNSPYSASKAASDHFVRAYGMTYKLPVLITHCSNNFGPYQHEKE